MNHGLVIYLLLGAATVLSGCGNGETVGVGGVDGGGVGALGQGYLAMAPYTTLIVEVDHAEGSEPDASALDFLRNRMETYVEKPGGIEFAGENAFSASEDVYGPGDILLLGERERAFRTSGDTASVQILYLNGSYTNPNVLGVAVNASTVALFRERIDDAVTELVLPAAIERAVLVHEIGHLFGLVNLTYQSAIAHEDLAHRHHDTNEDCVMYWAVEDVSISTILEFGPPSDFDNACRQDMELVRSME